MKKILLSMKKIAGSILKEVGDYQKYGEGQIEQELANLAKTLQASQDPQEKIYLVTQIWKLSEILKSRIENPSNRHDRIYGTKKGRWDR